MLQSDIHESNVQNRSRIGSSTHPFIRHCVGVLIKGVLALGTVASNHTRDRLPCPSLSLYSSFHLRVCSCHQDATLFWRKALAHRIMDFFFFPRTLFTKRTSHPFSVNQSRCKNKIFKDAADAEAGIYGWLQLMVISKMRTRAVLNQNESIWEENKRASACFHQVILTSWRSDSVFGRDQRSRCAWAWLNHARALHAMIRVFKRSGLWGSNVLGCGRDRLVCVQPN